jgi:nucleoside-diphosphate-sugar epimerase
MKKVLVIGGQGFIGFHLIHILKQRNYEVVIASRKLQHNTEFHGFPIIHFDLAHFSDEAILSVLKDFQVVVFGGGADDRTMPKEDPKAFLFNMTNR